MEALTLLTTLCSYAHTTGRKTLHHGILMAYGHYSGGNMAQNHLPRDTRVIVLKESRRAFSSYIRELRGGTMLAFTYSDTFIRDDSRQRPANAPY